MGESRYKDIKIGNIDFEDYLVFLKYLKISINVDYIYLKIPRKDTSICFYLVLVMQKKFKFFTVETLIS